MKKLSILIILIIVVFFTFSQIIFAQHFVRLGDLPRSDYTISIFQVVGFQEGYEGYKITYLDNNYEPRHLYLPTQLRDKYSIYTPQNNTYDQNFLITWKKEDRITRVEWFMPKVINYNLPNFVVKPFSNRDKDIFKSITEKGKIVFGTEVGGLAPEIKAPGGE